MINSSRKAPATPSRPNPPAVSVHPQITVLPAPSAPAPQVDVTVQPQITVQPAAVILPEAKEMLIPGHPKQWNIEVVERDSLGLIKRVIATAVPP